MEEDEKVMLVGKYDIWDFVLISLMVLILLGGFALESYYVGIGGWEGVFGNLLVAMCTGGWFVAMGLVLLTRERK